MEKYLADYGYRNGHGSRINRKAALCTGNDNATAFHNRDKMHSSKGCCNWSVTETGTLIRNIIMYYLLYTEYMYMSVTFSDPVFYIYILNVTNFQKLL